MNLMEHLPALIIAIPLFAAFLTPIIDRFSKKGRDAFVFIFMALTLILVVLLAKDVFDSKVPITYVMGASDPHQTIPTQSAVPIRIILEIDAMSIFMVIISILISFIGLIYSFSHIKEGGGKFYTLFLLMLVGMIGMELTGDLFNLFVFLEILSISSAALIAFEIKRETSFEAAIKYIVISSIAALFVLFAVGLFYGEYNLLNIAAIANAMKFTRIDKIALILLFSAFVMKAGTAPMHMWLPDAYGEAPGAVSMVLIATTQASLYALLRVCFTLYNESLPIIMPATLILLGLASIFIGVTMALVQNDIKRLIAYAAVAEVGYIVLAIGVGLYGFLKSGEIEGYGIKALQGGIFHIFNDVLDVGLMFLVAGGVIYMTKERNMNKLGGLAHSMKYSSILFLIGLAAVAGLPPLNGFASKLMIYESIYKVSPILSIVAILASILMLSIFVKIFQSIFTGPKVIEANEVPKCMLAGMIVIAGLIIFFGLFPEMIVKNLVEPAVNALLNYGEYISAVTGV
ncbi:MAG TPA: NADH:ubiquinone oxidoreductase [Thermoplasmatales archaeon]|nr:NADH:ubiquinone oxidoreductase [Thermoplasmatales archaeon]